MAIDLAQFQQLFFEESHEGLDVMETGLLSLESGASDDETINTIFRAAHSIKGGSGTFGFTEVSDFTHLMETLLDEMRDGRRKVTTDDIKILLESVDCLREMIAAIRQEQAVNSEKVEEHKQRLEKVLCAESLGGNTPVSDVVETNFDQTQHYEIEFKPNLSMLQTGNDPVRIFRELKAMGTFSSQLDVSCIPDFFDFEPHNSYLSWRLSIQGNFNQTAIEEVFEWVEDECELSIRLISPASSDSADNPPVEADNSDKASKKMALMAKTEASGKTTQPKLKTSTSSGSIRVDTQKIDALINRVGELVITQSMLSMIGDDFDMSQLDQLNHGLAQMERHTRELQESVLSIRMLPISFIFSRFPRMVHDVSNKLGKKIQLEMVGEHTEVDKTVVEKLADPLVHLVRNSLDHGIEMPEERVAAGKPEVGMVTLQAFQRSDNVIVEIKDDGRGLDPDKLKAKAIEKGLISADSILTKEQIFELIFMPGFSTAEMLTDLSGRGVGMDVVKQNIQTLGGEVKIHSEEGKGTTISIFLPLTLAILDGQTIAVGDERYILPLGSIIESLPVKNKPISPVAGGVETIEIQGEFIPIIRLYQVFNIPNAKAKEITEGLVVIAEGQGIKCGLLIDRLLGQQQAVIKSLEENYRKVDGISAATILGDGSVALILDLPGLVKLTQKK
jgi:two-component system chemotaxis sensor kinase CheA